MSLHTFDSTDRPFTRYGALEPMSAYDSWVNEELARRRDPDKPPQRTWPKWQVNLALFVMGFVGAFVWAIGG